jgi:hypothetical protein
VRPRSRAVKRFKKEEIRVRPHADQAERWVGSYRFVIRGVLWVIYLAVVVGLIIWWVRT